MTLEKLKTMNKKTQQIFKKFCFLLYHVLLASVGALHIYIYICFYFVLANNKEMTEQHYILQIISDDHQNSNNMIFISKSWEFVTV